MENEKKDEKNEKDEKENEKGINNSGLNDEIKDYINDKLVTIENQIYEKISYQSGLSKTPIIDNNSTQNNIQNPILLSNLAQSNELNPQIQSMKNKENKILSLENENIDDFVHISSEHINKPKNRIFDDICSVCSSKIFYEKYICCICTNCSLCTNCEHCHNYHPLIKVNCQNISNLDEIYHFLSTHQMKNKKPSTSSFFEDVFKLNTVEFKLEICSTYCSMRQNSILKLPIYIQNMSDKKIDKRVNLYLVPKSSKDLYIPILKLRDGFDKNEGREYELEVRSNSNLKLFDFKVELYCSDDSVKISCDTVNMKIEVNVDADEDLINAKYAQFNRILIQSKHHKKMLDLLINEVEREKVLNNEMFNEISPIVVLHYFLNNDWNYEDTKKCLIDNFGNNNQMNRNQLNL